jgi:NADPH-dependent curcumin reductase CurA
MDAVLHRMNLHGRVALCGLISEYTKETHGPSNLALLIVKRLKVQGFLIFDYASRFTEAATELGKWKMMGKLKDKQTVVEGLQNAPDAINMLFTGGNIGKTLVKV